MQQYLNRNTVERQKSSNINHIIHHHQHHQHPQIETNNHIVGTTTIPAHISTTIRCSNESSSSSIISPIPSPSNGSVNSQQQRDLTAMMMDYHKNLKMRRNYTLETDSITIQNTNTDDSNNNNNINGKRKKERRK